MKRIFTSLFAICIVGSNFISAQNVQKADFIRENGASIKEVSVTNDKAAPLYGNNETGAGFKGIYSNTSIGSTPGSCTLADDFTVPAGKQWNLDSIYFDMYYIGVAPTGYIVDFYENDATGAYDVPGAIKYSLPFTINLTQASVMYRNVKLPLTPATEVFTPGTYWVSLRGIYSGTLDFQNGLYLNRYDSLISPNYAQVQDSIGAYFTGNPPWQGIIMQGETIANSIKFSLFGTEGFPTGDGPTTKIALENNAVVAYPNPAKDQITFATSNTAITNVNIYDVTGSLVETVSMSNSSSVVHNVEKYESGVYFYKSLGNNDELIGAGKFIVK